MTKEDVTSSRDAVRKNIASSCKSAPTSKIIRFSNNDVPNYLQQLDKFEERSNQTRHMVE